MTRRALHRPALVTTLVVPLLIATYGGAGGGGSIEGIYESGTTRLTLHGGGKATFRSSTPTSSARTPRMTGASL